MRGKDDHTTTVSHPVKRRTNGGFLPLVLGVSAVSGSLILGMSTNGPYPRLQTASSAPVTAYETQPDARAVMARLCRKSRWRRFRSRNMQRPGKWRRWLRARRPR